MNRFTTASFATGLIVGSIFFSAIVSAWTAPTGAPPTNDASTPVNLGTAAQTKNGTLGVNGFAVFGNTLLGGVAGSNAYLNFGATSGTSGYGIRDNAGVIEAKSSGGSWSAVQTTATSVSPYSGVFGASGSVTINPPYNSIEIHGKERQPNGTSTFYVYDLDINVFKVGGVWQYAWQIYESSGTGTLVAGVQQCVGLYIPTCITANANGTFTMVGAATSGYGISYLYTVR